MTLIHPSFGSNAPKTKNIRVLIVDDSLTIRRLLRLVLEADPKITVVGEAENPIEARTLIKETDPDVITLDVEMPRMDGIEFLSRLMRLRPTPVVMISTLTHKGSEFAVQALSLGAIDVFGKPVGPDPKAWQEIIPLVKAAARARVSRADISSDQKSPEQLGAKPKKLIAIGASTGGVDALETVLSQFPSDCPPTLIVQHMPALFLESLVRRLNQKFAPKVALAEERMSLEQGVIYFAPGGIRHLQVAPDGQRLSLIEGDKISGHRPSVDVMFESLAAHAAHVVGCMLTGMGRDGAQGMLACHKNGARTIAQDETTSVVFGMPRAAIEVGAVDTILPLAKIAPVLLSEAMKDATRPKRRLA